MLWGFLPDVDLCGDDATLMEDPEDCAEEDVEDDPHTYEYSRGGAGFWEMNGGEVCWNHGNEEASFLVGY